MIGTSDNRSISQASGTNNFKCMPAPTSSARSRQYLLMLIAAFFVVACFSLIFSVKTDAKTSYPIINENTTKAQLSKQYSFDIVHSSTTMHYGYIYRNGKVVAQLSLQGYSRSMFCVGKYGKRFYFNVTDGVLGKAVYSYKLGDKKFKRICNNLYLNYFKKGYTERRKNYCGLMNKRYILARASLPTDAYDGYGTAYVYDLKKNKKTKLGHARDIIWIGKKIYWTTTSPYDWAKANNPKIVVKSANLSGKNIKTIKSIQSKSIQKSSYGSGRIDKHYVTWDFMIGENGKYWSETVKEKYR